jgi:hypothetical protein
MVAPPDFLNRFNGFELLGNDNGPETVETVSAVGARS